MSRLVKRCYICGLYHLKMNYKILFSDTKRALLVTLLLAFVYQLILSLQGFDLCDEGGSLAFSQQIFRNPDTVRFYFMYYLGGVVGGGWNILFGWGGILSFRILTILLLLLTVYFTYLSLAKLIKPVVIPIATFSVLFMCNYGVVTILHDSLTALLVVVSVFFLLIGLNERKLMALFWAAFFCGANFFSRLANVTMVALGLLLFINYYYEKDFRRLGLNILSCFVGIFTGVAFVLLLAFVLGHGELLIQAVGYLTGFVADGGVAPDGTHNLPSLVFSYIDECKNIYTTMSIFVFTTIFSVFIYHRSKRKWVKIFMILFFVGIIVYYILYAFDYEKYYGIILFPILISCFVDRKNQSITLLNWASLIVMFFLPIGSSTPFRVMPPYSLWLAAFTSLLHVYRFISYKKSQERDNRIFGDYRIILLIFGLLYGIYGLYVVARNAYFDRGPRWEKRFRADNDKFTVFTSEKKAKIMDELLSELKKYVGKDDYLFAFESLPMVHYLTETKPYIGTPWVWIYTSDVFKQNLDSAVATIPLPVVLRQKNQPIGGYWTEPANMKVENDEGKRLFEILYKQAARDYFEKFLKDNGYQIAWENDLFAIYVIPK